MYLLVSSAAQSTQQAPPSTPTMRTAPPTREPQTTNGTESDLVQKLCQTVERLTTELTQAHLEIQNLHARINNMSASATSLNFSSDSPPLQESQGSTTNFSDAPWHNKEKIQALKQPAQQQREQHRLQQEAAAAHFFQPPQRTKASNTYIFQQRLVSQLVLYVPLFENLATVAILIHNDYETDFIDLLRRYNIPTKADFNPSSGSILADPKFTNLTPAEREATASTLQRTRIARALDHIRAPVKFAAAPGCNLWRQFETTLNTTGITLPDDDTNDIQMDDTQENSPVKDSLTSDDTLVYKFLSYVRPAASRSQWYKLSKTPVWQRYSSSIDDDDDLDPLLFVAVCKEYLDDNLDERHNGHNSVLLFACRPTLRSIICGKGVSAKPNLDENIYARHLKLREEEKLYPLPGATMPYVDKVMHSETIKEYKRNTKNISDFEEKDEVAMEFVQEILNASYNLYKTKQNIYEFESIFNDLYIYPYLKITANALFITREKSQPEFTVGEISLKAMSTQLDSVGLNRDDAGQYKADGVIKLYGIHCLEILLLETSFHFGCTDRSKVSFDHHKGLFGALSMLKTIADTFYFASIKQFGQMKVFFVHAAEKNIYLWSLRYEHEGRAYELWLEKTLHLQPEFEKQNEELPNVINFYWSMKCLLEETTDTMLKLQEEHNKKLEEYNCSISPMETLGTIVNPSILKLTEKNDKAGIVCYQKDAMFGLWRETNLKIKPDFGDKCDLVPELIQFCWETKVTSINKIIVALKQEHISIKSKYRYNPLKPVLLSNTINPIILKLMKEDDCSGMANLGPMYSPPHP
ncbi:hypothetical protein G6F16_011166 [Rhizopus arrhizus]|nr:hypothetical protein G6F19_011173 [Rhizopus arrhizus]KAG0864254.1 hypothetical protein G6F16_011166 [Rhizopus arrhizus]KAG1284461.1 hypothetical protein G6F66_010662 [Rhizopus arrhizus]KAG1383176.1 hypothetical protein G6F61_001609 [Rhizopus arrhizus]